MIKALVDDQIPEGVTLSPIFIKLAKKTIKITKYYKYYKWKNKTEPYDSLNYAFSYINDTTNVYNPTLFRSLTNCGTYEIHGLEFKHYDLLVQSICYLSVYENKCNYIYYGPRSQKYKHCIKVIQLLGGKKIGEFQHLGYQKKVHKGWTDIYQLKITKEDQDYLKTL